MSVSGIFPEIGSWTLPVNLASQRVIERLEFRYERDFEFAGLLHRFYRLVATAPPRLEPTTTSDCS